MPDTTKDRGLVGESVKAEWIGDVMKAKAEDDRASLGPMPKGMKMPAMPPYEPPWTSLGQAPTETQVEGGDYGGSA